MRNKYIRLMLLTLLAITASCDKQLSEPPANARVDGTAITDEKTAQIALNGAYYRFANVEEASLYKGKTTNWGDLSVAGALLSGAYSYGGYEGADQINNNISSRHVTSIWKYSYKLINQANGVISGVEAIDANKFTADRSNEILAEARFLRAFGHFKLLLFFSEWNEPNSANGVLIRDQFTNLSSIAKKRSTVQESYAFILQDLEFAIQHAKESNQKYYATKWSASLLKMRVLMMLGGNNSYTEVMQLADQIMTEGEYKLENQVKDIFHAKGLSSNEVMLGIKPEVNQEGEYNILSRGYYPGMSDLYMSTSYLKGLFNNDPRGQWMIGPANTNPGALPGTYYFSKFIPYGGNTSQLTETIYVMRLSEVYLLKAEAILRSGQSIALAKDLIKEVMLKGGVTDFTLLDQETDRTALLQYLYSEYQRSFAGEDAIEWMALMRLPFEQVKQLKPTITSKQQLYFPVPQQEFDQNPLFGSQNTGYGI